MLSFVGRNLVSTICAYLVGLAAGGACLASEPIELKFDAEVQNLHVLGWDLRERPRAGLQGICEDLAGDFRYGTIPHRLYYDDSSTKRHYVDFAVVYRNDGNRTILIDLDQDHVLECHEEVAFVGSPQRSEEVFRTLTLSWQDDGGPIRKQRYRLWIPTQAGASGELRYSVDLVDVPVARWTVDGHETIWVLYDGNYNGIYDRRFGDGILIDTSGEGRFSVDPYGDNFVSYHAPIHLPWATVEIIDVDPAGRSLYMAVSGPAAPSPRPLREGDRVPRVECQALDGTTINFGGATGSYQLVYFWVSFCGSSRVDLQKITRLLAELEPGHLSAVGVTMDEDRSGVAEAAAESDINWPQCYSGRTLWDNDLVRRFGARTPSDFVLIDRAGRLVASGTGADELQLHLGRIPRSGLEGSALDVH